MLNKVWTILIFALQFFTDSWNQRFCDYILLLCVRLMNVKVTTILYLIIELVPNTGIRNLRKVQAFSTFQPYNCSKRSIFELLLGHFAYHELHPELHSIFLVVSLHIFSFHHHFWICFAFQKFCIQCFLQQLWSAQLWNFWYYYTNENETHSFFHIRILCLGVREVQLV